ADGEVQLTRILGERGHAVPGQQAVPGEPVVAELGGTARDTQHADRLPVPAGEQRGQVATGQVRVGVAHHDRAAGDPVAQPGHAAGGTERVRAGFDRQVRPGTDRVDDLVGQVAGVDG